LTIQREGPSEPLPSPSRSPSVEEETKQVAKYPSLSEGEAILIHPNMRRIPKPSILGRPEKGVSRRSGIEGRGSLEWPCGASGGEEILRP